jgi:hypothetical protein
VNAQQPQVVKKNGSTLAGVEKHTPAFRLDQKSQAMLTPVRRAALNCIVNYTDYPH